MTAILLFACWLILSILCGLCLTQATRSFNKAFDSPRREPARAFQMFLGGLAMAGALALFFVAVYLWETGTKALLS